MSSNEDVRAKLTARLNELAKNEDLSRYVL